MLKLKYADLKNMALVSDLYVSVKRVEGGWSVYVDIPHQQGVLVVKNSGEIKVYSTFNTILKHFEDLGIKNFRYLG